MRKLIFMIVSAILFFSISAEYLIIAKNTGMDYENANLYHYNDNIELYISYNPLLVPNSIISIPYQNDKTYYLLQVNNDNISIPSSSIIYRDFDNGVILFRDDGNINIGKENEITRLFFNTPINKKTSVSTVISGYMPNESRPPRWLKKWKNMI